MQSCTLFFRIAGAVRKVRLGDHDRGTLIQYLAQTLTHCHKPGPHDVPFSHLAKFSARMLDMHVASEIS